MIYSVQQGQENSYTSSDPFVGVFTGGVLQPQTEVGGVTSSGKSSGSREHLVHRAIVDGSFLGLDPVAAGQEQNHWSRRVQLLGLGFVNAMSHRVPSGSLEEHTVAERTIFRLLSHFVVLDFVVNLEVETKLINGNLALTRVVLKRGSEESLGEEEPGNPEGRGCALIKPVLEEGSSFVEVNNPRGKGLHGQESHSVPLGRDLVIMQRGGHGIELFRHDYFTDQSLLHVDKMVLHHDEEGIVSDQLLGEHSVEATVVIGGEGLTGSLDVVSLRSLALDVGSDVRDTLFTGHSTASRSSGLEGQYSLKHVTSNLIVSGNLSVLVHTESLRLGVKRKLLDVGNVVGLTSSGDTSVVFSVREVEVIVENLRYEVATDNAEDEPSVNVISHTASVVDLSDQEVKHLVRHFIEVVEENLKLLLANTVIFIGEGVGDVPANTSELSSILHNSVEEAESE